jgi:hypothetical protein
MSRAGIPRSRGSVLLCCAAFQAYGGNAEKGHNTGPEDSRQDRKPHVISRAVDAAERSGALFRREIGVGV